MGRNGHPNFDNNNTSYVDRCVDLWLTIKAKCENVVIPKVERVLPPTFQPCEKYCIADVPCNDNQNSKIQEAHILDNEQ